MTRWVPALGVAAAAVTAACSAPVPSFSLPVADEGLLPVGTLRGHVWALEGDRFMPRPGAVVRVVGSDRRTTAAQDGSFRLDGLPVGPLRLSADPDDAGGVPCRLPAAFGVDRVPLILAPGSSDGPRLVGVLVDARGAGVPNGSVRCVDSAGGNRLVTADAAGCFAERLSPGATTASLTGFGVTPGGLHVETTSLTGVALKDGRAIAVSADRTEPLASPHPAPGDPATWRADHLPTRRDEVALSAPCAAGVWVPATLADDRLTVASPPPCEAGARLLPLGLE